MGRIYYKPDGNRVLVSVHVKRDDKEQRRHIEKLRVL
jgi:predicted RNA binding protein YcfA (HicA-like mRNA interferase family)